MLNSDYTARILNLEDVKITNVEDVDGILCIDIELPRKQHTCPSCGAGTDRIHDYRTQKLRIFLLAEKDNRLEQAASSNEKGKAPTVIPADAL